MKSLVSLFATKEEPAAPVVVEKPATERPARNEERRNGRQQAVTWLYVTSASLAKNVPRVKNAHHVKSVRPNP